MVVPNEIAARIADMRHTARSYRRAQVTIVVTWRLRRAGSPSASYTFRLPSAPDAVTAPRAPLPQPLRESPRSDSPRRLRGDSRALARPLRRLTRTTSPGRQRAGGEIVLVMSANPSGSKLRELDVEHGKKEGRTNWPGLMISVALSIRPSTRPAGFRSTLTARTLTRLHEVDAAIDTRPPRYPTPRMAPSMFDAHEWQDEVSQHAGQVRNQPEYGYYQCGWR